MSEHCAEIADNELLKAISLRDVYSFNTLYHRYNRLLYKRVYGRLENPDQSQEIMQEFWVTVWTKPDFVKTTESGSAKAFFYHYLSYRVLDCIRKTNFNIIATSNCESLQEVEEELSYMHVSEEFEIKELELLIDSILKDLSGQTAEIFVLHWRNGYSLKETAQILKLNERTVRQKSKESIAILKKMIERGEIDSASFKVVREMSTVVVYVILVSEKMMN